MSHLETGLLILLPEHKHCVLCGSVASILKNKPYHVYVYIDIQFFLIKFCYTLTAQRKNS